MNTDTFDLDYFIEKFESIPESLWTIGGADANGRKDAYGHCGEVGESTTEEALALYEHAKTYGSVVLCNDGDDEYIRYGTTPKQRVVNFLKEIQAINRKHYLS